MVKPQEINVAKSAHKPRCLIWGEGPAAPWHPLAPVLPALRDILEPDFACTVRDDGQLEPADLWDLSLLINCRDLWEALPDPVHAILLKDFLGHGGGILSLHNGICLARHPDFLPLLGAVFTGHPEAADLAFSLDIQGWPVQPPDTGLYIPGSADTRSNTGTSPGKSGFVLHEEPYRFDFPQGCVPRVFLSYSHQEHCWPAGWIIQSGADKPGTDSSHGDRPGPDSPGRNRNGQTAYLAPGHSPAVFGHPDYAALISRTAWWCAAGT